MAGGNPWSVPAGAEVLAEARQGRWNILLTPTKPVPGSWVPPLDGAEVLCLASGGGQQGPVLAAAGAVVTVLDASPRQLAQDRSVAERESLEITTVLGNMTDLSMFADASFDLIVHPISNCFVPDVRPVWREAHRVLRPGGSLLSGFSNGVVYVFDDDAMDRGVLKVTGSLPHSDPETLSEAELGERILAKRPLEFGHTLTDQIGGQLDAGFLLCGFYEDRTPGRVLDERMATFVATRAVKPRTTEGGSDTKPAGSRNGGLPENDHEVT